VTTLHSRPTLCSWPYCRRESEALFHAGATALNPTDPAELCAEHMRALGDELDKQAQEARPHEGQD
jgi:hypothetical protein